MILLINGTPLIGVSCLKVAEPDFSNLFPSPAAKIIIFNDYLPFMLNGLFNDDFIFVK